jgi:hypothetical protein
MIESTPPSGSVARPATVPLLTTASQSAVSWPAIFAGAAGAAALSLILLVLGTGLGFGSMSPWTAEGATPSSLGFGAILWICLTSLAASGLGGYLAGRLRVKWDSVHADEIHFRDTAHGFLAWAVATIVTAALLTSALASIAGGAAKAGAAAAVGVGAAAAPGAASAMHNPATGTGNDSGSRSTGESGLDYFSDSLYRPAAPGAGASAPSTPPDSQGSYRSGAEANRIFAHSLQAGAVSPADTQYLGQLVAGRTGMSQQDAEKRVSETFARTQTAMQEGEAKAKAAADQARKAATYASLWLFISLLLGAFTASLCAIFGGRQRDF